MKRLLILLSSALICFSAPASDGLVSFNVIPSIPANYANIIEENGALEFYLMKGDGEFQFSIEDGSENYHVNVSNDMTPIQWSLKERSTTRFTINLYTLALVEDVIQFVPYNPSSLCTVTVERISD